ncbi:hypothetical protein AYR62_13040 [Secundilactobacillus paracollinoides]|uniref:HTH tetR-type domain-containing protein n=3 Tax=Secundilactobacillus paracollinoides TaxID=240427 RepID=A0A1B2IWK2_9LACO|nr:TetR/AcrR family transcriptional regulator [Secundilactobacillus paracollinoides]ANZ60584.1 hypothetical protein AYR61_03965 [Secundilactobacillus paracollinoides]ANZ64906.1 hypothetical protein AYR62_13040 [Secundilactobacillus paracollinoides]ANZ66423.1 hypothetical protein AYR63_04265 [Secundilactobacillus paracollinoides]
MTQTLKQQRTKLDIVTTMNTLLKTTPFDQITIGTICKTAMIHHSTFYRYFDDKYALLGEVLMLICKPVQADLNQGVDFMTAISRVMTANQAQLRNMTSQNKSTTVYTDLTKILADNLKTAIISDTTHPLITQLRRASQPEFLAYAYAGMLVGIIQKWNEDPQTTTLETFSGSFKHDMTALLQTF